jgi:small GTP-binding protein
MIKQYNVVFVGKTGVGKSTLINYLYGKDIAQKGIGRPVTRGFESYRWEIRGLPVKLFDSRGLEVGNDKQWISQLNEELKRHGTDKPVEDWFHTVFYCIQASGHKIEPFEEKVIKRFKKNKYRVAIILTKADTINEEEEEDFRSKIHSYLGNSIPVIPVCSEEKKLRSGIVSKKFGKDEVEKQAYGDFWDSIVLRLPEHCIQMLENRIDEWHDEQLAYINGCKKDWRYQEVSEKINLNTERLIDEQFKKQKLITKEVEKALMLFGTLSYFLKNPDIKINLNDEQLPALIPNNESDFKWWEVIFIPPGVLIYLLTLPWHRKWNREVEQEQLFDYVKHISNKLKEKLPEIEKYIEKALKDAKQA